MSAWIVDKAHIDLLVRVALDSGRDPLRWWQVDEEGKYAGWRELDELGKGLDDEARAASGVYTPDELGAMLWTENVCSVSYRYPSDSPASRPGPLSDDIDGEAISYQYVNPGYTMTPGEAFRAIDCLDYQSCEHPGWRTSEAFAFLQALRERLCTQVDGYGSAPWGWSSSDLEGRELEFSRPHPLMLTEDDLYRLAYNAHGESRSGSDRGDASLARCRTRRSASHARRSRLAMGDTLEPQRSHRRPGRRRPKRETRCARQRLTRRGIHLRGPIVLHCGYMQKRPGDAAHAPGRDTGRYPDASTA
jgi:hypothetical protein